mmetsp:Transcript_25963/g.82705  ORF Transcript_25963/g.82705 Transcript_25963/m.82705 type:complete len:206 (+) Transcript_25963:1590-2207(+)
MRPRPRKRGASVRASRATVPKRNHAGRSSQQVSILAFAHRQASRLCPCVTPAPQMRRPRSPPPQRQSRLPPPCPPPPGPLQTPKQAPRPPHRRRTSSPRQRGERKHPPLRLLLPPMRALRPPCPLAIVTQRPPSPPSAPAPPSRPAWQGTRLSSSISKRRPIPIIISRGSFATCTGRASTPTRTTSCAAAARWSTLSSKRLSSTR